MDVHLLFSFKLLFFLGQVSYPISNFAANLKSLSRSLSKVLLELFPILVKLHQLYFLINLHLEAFNLLGFLFFQYLTLHLKLKFLLLLILQYYYLHILTLLTFTEFLPIFMVHFHYLEPMEFHFFQQELVSCFLLS